MRAKEFLQEIDAAHGIQSLAASLATVGDIIGTIDGYNVTSYTDSSAIFYMLKNDSSIISYVAISNELYYNNRHAIHQYENVSKIAGAMTALLAYITKKLGLKLVFLPTEKMTKDGIGWVIKIITAGGRGFTITDQNFIEINVDDIMKEWDESLTGNYSKTAIFVENTSNRFNKIFEDQTGLLKPPIMFIGDTRLL